MLGAGRFGQECIVSIGYGQDIAIVFPIVSIEIFEFVYLLENVEVVCRRAGIFGNIVNNVLFLTTYFVLQAFDHFALLVGQ